MQNLMTWEGWVVWLLVTLVGSFGGSWFGSYLKKKGENYATREDLGELVRQMRALTAAQEEIRSEISEKAWDRQRRWELKRDALIDSTKKLSALLDKLTSLQGGLRSRGRAVAWDEEARAYIGERAKEWNDAAADFETAAMVVGLVCKKHVAHEMQALVWFTRGISDKLTSGVDLEAFSSSIGELAGKLTRVQEIMREELGGIAPG